MITLFIDTSTDTLSIAIFKDNYLLSSFCLLSSEHSTNTTIKIKEMLNNNSIKPEEVNKIMVINGPGSFTGIRIGVTVAKIFAWANKIKIVPISTLKAYALSNDGYDYYVSLIDARRDYFYASIYDKNYDNVMSDSYISRDELLSKMKNLNNVLVIGNKDLSVYKSVDNKLDFNKIYQYYKNEEGISPHLLNPVYLKKTEAEEKLEDKMVREYEAKDFNSVCILGRDINLSYVFKLSPVGKCFVYELDGEVVGFFIVDLFDDRSELIDICVALAHRNKKIGSKLLDKALDVSKNNGCASITLEVRCDNNFAIKLYKSKGFKITNIRKKYYNNGSIDAYVMHREL